MKTKKEKIFLTKFALNLLTIFKILFLFQRLKNSINLKIIRCNFY